MKPDYLDRFYDYLMIDKDQRKFEAKVKSDNFKRKINERPRRKNKRKK